MEVTLAWWNTGMSPPTTSKKAKANKKDPSIFLTVLEYLLVEDSVDFLGLCEVDPADILAIRGMLKLIGLGDYEVCSLYSSKANRVNDFCVVYNSKKITYLDHAFVEKWDEANVFYKVGVRVDFKFGQDESFAVYLSHWQSRRSMNNVDHRAHLGRYLRDSINSIFQLNGDDSIVILMGDFNDDPFNASITHHLKSTRDKSFVLAHKQMLYNPFWRVMGALIPHAHDDLCLWNYPSGTCFFKENKEYTYWKTFDQILFSSSFFGGTQWHLSEESTKIYSLREFGRYFQDWSVVSDHLPVATKIERLNHV